MMHVYGLQAACMLIQIKATTGVNSPGYNAFLTSLTHYDFSLYENKLDKKKILNIPDFFFFRTFECMKYICKFSTMSEC